MSNLKDLTEKQFANVAGVWGSPTQVPQFTVDSKGRITSITTVSTPAYPSLVATSISGTMLTLLFDQAIDQIAQDSLLVSCFVDGVQVPLASPAVIDNDKILAALSKEVFAEAIVFANATGFQSANVALPGLVSNRAIRNLGRPPDWAVEYTVQELGIGAAVLWFEEGRRLISTELNSGSIAIWSIGSQTFKTQQVTVGSCTGFTPIKAFGSVLAIAVSGLVLLFVWDKSCQSFVPFDQISVSATDLALSNDLLFLTTVSGLEIYDLSSGKASLISNVIMPDIKALHAQSNGYQIAMLINDKVQIWTRRTVNSWSQSSSVPVGSIDSVTAFNGETLAISSKAQGLTKVWSRVSGNWSMSASFPLSGSTITLIDDLIAVGDYKANLVYTIGRSNKGLWQSAKVQRLSPSLVEDYGWSISLSENVVIVGSPQSSTIRKYKKEE